MKNKITTYHDLGFEIHLVNPPLKKQADGTRVPSPNLPKLKDKVMKLLIKKKYPFTGAQVHFIRSYLKLSQKEFSRLLNLASQSLVSLWEAKKERFTGMDINTEIMLRIRILDAIGLLKKPVNLIKKIDSVTPRKPKKTETVSEILELKTF